MDLPSDIAISKTFNVADLNDYHLIEQLYLDYNSRTGSFKERRTDVEDQSKNKSDRARCRQPKFDLSTGLALFVDRPRLMLIDCMQNHFP